MSIRTILVSQPKPASENSPYFELAKKYNLTIDFRPFIQVEGAKAKEVRKQRVNFEDYSAVIFTSKVAVDHFFRIAEEIRFEIPDSLKYFCISEAIALYLQKYVVYRKRKIFFGKQNIVHLADVMKKHKNEKFLLPCTDILRNRIPDTLSKYNFDFKKVILYRTVAADLSDLSDVKYDMLVFYSPGGIESLFKNFPHFKQNNTFIAAFGATTAKAVQDKNLRVDLHAPQPNAPSMVGGIELFIKSLSAKSA